MDTQPESVGSRQADQKIINDVQVRVSFGQVSTSYCLDVAPVLYKYLCNHRYDINVYIIFILYLCTLAASGSIPMGCLSRLGQAWLLLLDLLGFGQKNAAWAELYCLRNP